MLYTYNVFLKIVSEYVLMFLVWDSTHDTQNTHTKLSLSAHSVLTFNMWSSDHGDHGDDTGTGPAVFKWPPFKNHRAFINTRNTLPASVYKHPGIYKRSANMTIH